MNKMKNLSWRFLLYLFFFVILSIGSYKNLQSQTINTVQKKQKLKEISKTEFDKYLTNIKLISLSTLFSHRYSNRRGYSDMEEPLLPVNWEYTGVGFFLLIIGYIWIISKKDKEPEKSENNGLGGCLFMIIGAVLLIPLLTWVFAILRLLIGIGILFYVIIIVIVFIIALFLK